MRASIILTLEKQNGGARGGASYWKSTLKQVCVVLVTFWLDLRTRMGELGDTPLEILSRCLISATDPGWRHHCRRLEKGTTWKRPSLALHHIAWKGKWILRWLVCEERRARRTWKGLESPSKSGYEDINSSQTHNSLRKHGNRERWTQNCKIMPRIP